MKYILENYSKLKVKNIQIIEEINKPIQITCIVQCKPFYDFNNMVSKHSSVKVDSRIIKFVINQIEVLTNTHEMMTAKIAGFSFLQELIFQSYYRTYQNISYWEIISKILKEYNILFQEKSVLNKEIQTIVIQYGQNDLSFLYYLMDKGGMFFFYDKDILCFSSDHSAYKHVKAVANMETVSSLFEINRISTGVGISNFNYQQVENTGSKILGKEERLTRLFPHNYKDNQSIENGITSLYNKISSKESLLRYKSTLNELVPGTILEMGYPWKQLLCIKTCHYYNSYEDLEYTNQSELMEYKNNFYMADYISDIPSLTTAVVVESPLYGEFSQISICFPWDCNKLTHSIRMATNFAGSGIGAQFDFQAGQEVVVDFLDRDWNRPIITSVLYNSENINPYKDKKNIVGIRHQQGNEGFNEILMDDSFSCTSEKDMNMKIRNNYVSKVETGNLLIDIIQGTGNIKTSNVSIEMGTEYKLYVTGNCNIISTGDCNIQSSQSCSVTAPQITIDTPQLKLNGVNTEINSSNLKITSLNIDIISAAAMSITTPSLQLSATSFVITAMISATGIFSVTGSLMVQGLITQNGMPVMVI